MLLTLCVCCDLPASTDQKALLCKRFGCNATLLLGGHGPRGSMGTVPCRFLVVVVMLLTMRADQGARGSKTRLLCEHFGCKINTFARLALTEGQHRPKAGKKKKTREAGLFFWFPLGGMFHHGGG